MVLFVVQVKVSGITQFGTWILAFGMVRALEILYRTLTNSVSDSSEKISARLSVTVSLAVTWTLLVTWVLGPLRLLGRKLSRQRWFRPSYPCIRCLAS